MKKWKVIGFSIVTALLLVGLVAVPAVAQPTSADRTIATPTLAPGGSTLITVDVYSAATQPLILDEDPPLGWAVTSVDDDGATYDAAEVKWFWSSVAAGETKTVQYQLTAGAVPGPYTVDGVLKTYPTAQWLVTGDDDITVTGAVDGTSADRTIATPTLSPGGSTLITVDVYSAAAQGLILDEDPPASWAVTSVDDDGATYDAAEVKWFWSEVAAGGTKTVQYQVTAPLDADGGYTVDGVLKALAEQWLVTGDDEITVSAVPEPFEDTFDGCLDEGDREALDSLVIPAGATDLDIQLDADADLDLELWDGTTHVIGWKAEIKSKGPSTGTYEGDTFGYSGWDAFDEYITADGPLSQAYTVMVYGFKAGCYEAAVSYIPAGPDYDPPEIDITPIADVSLGSSVTVSVSASDPSGVQWLWFSVWPDTYPAGYGDEVPVAALLTFDDAGSVTFVPGWAGTYTVQAWAADTIDNTTPEGVPVTETFEVD